MKATATNSIKDTNFFIFVIFVTKNKITKLRTIKDLQDFNKYKAYLPVATWNGVFNYRDSSGCELYSSFTALDFDKVADMRAHKEWLKTIPCVYAIFTTPSGHGIKAIVLHDNRRKDQHPDLYAQLLKLLDCKESENLEDLIWEAQELLVDDDKSLFGGEISSLLAWASPDLSLDISKFSVDSFSLYLEIIKHLFKNKEDNDLTRRALLAFGVPHFPWGVTYGWGDNWKEIFQTSLVEVQNFLDACKEKCLDNIISQSSFNLYVAYPQLLAYSNRKNIRNYRIWGPTLCRRE